MALFKTKKYPIMGSLAFKHLKLAIIILKREILII
tara:strand:- start:479 stop:583 length:105 start_codon:yes stop_codon:yes gene_type:complete